MHAPRFKDFYPRWIGWNMLGMGITLAILSVIEFSGLMNNGLYTRIQSLPLMVLIYLLIAALTAACIWLTQRQLMAPYLKNSLGWWGLASAAALGTVLPTAGDMLFALAAAAVLQWLVLRSEFARAGRWLLWCLLPAELLAIGASFLKQYFLGLMLGDWLTGASTLNMLLFLMGYNLLSLLIITLISGVGMQRILQNRVAQAGQQSRHSFLLLWVLAPVAVNWVMRMLSAAGLFKWLQQALWPSHGSLPSFEQIFLALLTALAFTWVLRRFLPRAGWWLLPTLLGSLLVSYAVNLFSSEIPILGYVEVWLSSVFTASESVPTILASNLLAIFQSLVLGLLQAVVLRLWKFKRPWLWPLMLMLSEVTGPWAPFPLVRELISGWGFLKLAAPGSTLDGTQKAEPDALETQPAAELTAA